MFGIVVAAAAVSIIIWYFFVRPLSFWTKLGVRQSKPWIFFGDSWVTMLQQLSLNDFITKIYKMHPETRYNGIYSFNNPILILKDPELIKQITVKDFEHFTDHPLNVDPESDPLWNNTLLALQGERWKDIRSILTPTFTSSKLKRVYLLMLETAENFVKHFLEKEDDIIEFEMKDSYTRFTNDIIASTAFGVQVNSLKDKKNTFYEMGRKLTELTGISIIKVLGRQASPTLFKYLRIPFLDQVAAKYFSGVMAETIREREENNVVRSDMIQLMLEARKDNNVQGKSKSIKISNDEITAQSLIFFFAGFDTVSTAMCYGTYELALQKDIQDRLRQEINETQKNGKVSYNDLTQMKYLDMVVSEVLRKWPPFASTERVCTKPYTIKPVNKDEKPVPISVNQELWVPIYGLQRDPKYFPNPEKFDPERFSDENKDNIVPYTYMPFGVGPRICIGNRFALLEIKALLFNLLLNFEVVPTKKTMIPLVLSKDVSQIPENGFWLGLKRIRT